MPESATIGWVIEASEARSAGRQADRLGIPVVPAPPVSGFYLQQQAEGLVLHHAAAGRGDTGLRIDFLDGTIERRQAGGRKSPLAKACGLHRRPEATVLDATCGLGRDSATLASLGCQVTALERHPALFALVADARERAQRTDAPPAWLDYWQTLHWADASRWLADYSGPLFDIVYIDPMFDVRRRKARPQKALAWLSALVGPDTDIACVLERARRQAGKRVVVKQHARAAALGCPDLAVHGKAVRFDIYLTPG